MKAKHLSALAVSRNGEVRDRTNGGFATGPVLGVLRKIEDGKRLWQATTVDHVAIGEAQPKRRDALAVLYRHLKS